MRRRSDVGDDLRLDLKKLAAAGARAPADEIALPFGPEEIIYSDPAPWRG